MRYTLTFREEDYDTLRDAVFSLPGCEGAAYLLCGRSVAGAEVRLLVREVIPVAEQHYLVREPDRLSIGSASYVPVAKRARLTGQSLLFVHSHPGGLADFSPQDDREEPKLLQFFQTAAPDGPHGSLVLSPIPSIQGRIWEQDGWTPIERVRVLGRRFRFYDSRPDEEPIPEFFERQVRAFGPDVQRLLHRLQVGVVGAGGTGSAVIEQLVRVGVGTISVFDRDLFERTNVNRVYGSAVSDAGSAKVAIAESHVRQIGLGTVIHVYPRHITEEATARHLRECDVVFGCTDKQAPRGILVQLGLRYLIPVFDLGVKIDTDDQDESRMRGVIGRVTTLIPREACLFCRQGISAQMIALEALSPEERRLLADEGYAPTLDTNAPAVITFTTAVAAQAVSEFLHRLTGFMGEERRSTEVLMFFHESTVRTNRTPADPDCLCMKRERWGRGDSRDFLGLSWPDPVPDPSDAVTADPEAALAGRHDH